MSEERMSNTPTPWTPGKVVAATPPPKPLEKWQKDLVDEAVRSIAERLRAIGAGNE